MMISTRGRYALRVMLDLAENSDGAYIAMKEVAERQQVSLKYLERILPLLVEQKLVEGIRGKGGGYRLTREPDEYSLGEILRATEGDLAPVACLEKNAKPCPRSKGCKTLPMWKELDELICNYLDNKTLADLLEGK
ncbi:MAG: Rrf2 family transcriptional regulator [Oscillospiraceae bacterium]|nr:Rrf2 family transcriptional regulator [Oscillospiraceae bacterium]